MESKKTKWWNTRPYKDLIAGVIIVIIGKLLRLGVEKVGVPEKNQNMLFLSLTASVFIVIGLCWIIKKFSKKSS